jgi:ER membrane protein complex subunit 3
MEGMMDGMKKQLVMMVPQMVIMGWINFFFQGFVASESFSLCTKRILTDCSFQSVKLPFPLTLGFKSMLQRGVETQDMDVRWVSSLSWYFLNFFGLNGVYRLILGNDNGAQLAPDIAAYIKFLAAADSSRDLAASSPFAAATQQQPGQAQDYNKLFKAEKDNLELAEGLYSWACKDVELRVLQRYGKLSAEATKR